MINSSCHKMDCIFDAEACCKDGVFYLGRLPSCLPALFTVRFTAPKDFAAGDTFVVKDVEMPVMTSQMEPAAADIFKAGAVIVCEIDLDRELAFVRTGSAACACEDVKFQTSEIVYYIDPNGDDSPNNPGGADSPFKTLGGAGRAAWENIVMNPLGQLVFSFNPGTYDLSSTEQEFMIQSTHPNMIRFQGTDENEKPLIRADHFSSGVGKREFRGLKLHATSMHNVFHPLSPYENGMTVLRDAELILSKSHTYTMSPYCGGSLRIYGCLRIDGNGFSPISVLACHSGNLWTHYATISIDNIPSVEHATAWTMNGEIYFEASTISGSVSGMRYAALGNGLIHTLNAGPDFIPGTIAGATASGGQYL